MDQVTFTYHCLELSVAAKADFVKPGGEDVMISVMLQEIMINHQQLCTLW